MNALQQFIQSKPCGFLKSTDMPDLIALDRLCQVLIRFQGCRLLCAAQDCAHIIKAMEASGDYCRDVSFPTESVERAAAWQPNCKVTPVSMLPASFTDERPAKQRPGAWAISKRVHPGPDEGDYGGVFDGNQVTSDADPGL